MLDFVNRPANLSSSTCSSLVVGWSVVGIFGWQSVFEEGEIVGEEEVVHNAAQIYNSVERNGLLSALYFRRACTDTASSA